MDRKTVAGPIRNKERSRQKLLKAVGRILIKSGPASLGVTRIAKVAKVDKKMIYKYFGSLNGLLDEYLSSQDFWSNVKGEKLPTEFPEGGRDFVKAMLLSQFDYVKTNLEFQKILLWGLSEPREALKNLTDKQEANGEVLLQGITDPYFKENAQRYRATMAIIIAGTYYLNLFSNLNGSTFCGVDLSTEKGRAEIAGSLSFLIDQTYNGLGQRSSG